MRSCFCIRLSEHYLVSLHERDQFRRFLFGKPILKSEKDSWKVKGYLDPDGKPVPEFLRVFLEHCHQDIV